MNLLPVMTRLRSLARRAGLLRWLGGLAALRGKAYEERFGKALVFAVKPGDVVWDVGANLGYYTERFAARVGRPGLVVAFEPVPTCFAALGAKLGAHPNVVLRQEALGAASGVVPMALAPDPLGATHSLVGAAAAGGTEPSDPERGPRIEVPLRRGDDVVAAGVRAPTVVKIDVEGFEEEVVRGLAATLSRPACRAVFIEVHFALLEAKGTPQAPQVLVELLRGHGFKVRWLDPSHLAATR